MSYKEFSYFYDYFNYNADYDQLFEKIRELASQAEVCDGIACDLGCGTGELAFRLNDAGFDVIAVDNSDEMLDVFYDKKDELGADSILVLKQDITQLDMYGTIDLFTCTFDTVNHLEGPEKVQSLFEKVSLFLDPNGVFIFDMNTPYKHKNILKNEKFNFEESEAECIWQNTLLENESRTKISITINDKQNGSIYSEEFFEYYYSADQIISMLKNRGLQVINLLDGESFSELKDDSQRFLFVVKKEN